MKDKIKYRDQIIDILKRKSISPEIINEKLKRLKTNVIKQKIKSFDLITRPQIKIYDLLNEIPEIKELINKIEEREEEIIESAEINIKYKGYIEREKKLAEKLKRLENIKIDENIDYTKMMSISTEARQKLMKIKPVTIGQASRISGVSPADISVLLIYMGR